MRNNANYMKPFSELRKNLLDKKQSPQVVRINKELAEDLAAMAYAYGLTISQATKLAIKHWLTLPPSQALGISKADLYRMAELDGVKIDA